MRVFESKSLRIRFSHPLHFAYTLRRLTREWREKSDWSKAIPEYYLTIYPHQTEDNRFSFYFLLSASLTF